MFDPAQGVGLDQKGGGVNRVVRTFLAQSQLVQSYVTSFRTATGLHLEIEPFDDAQTEASTIEDQNTLCGHVRRFAAGCHACRQTRLHLLQSISLTNRPQSICCPAGQTELAVPVVVGRQCVAALVAGQVFSEKPTPEGFARIVHQFARWGGNTNLDGLERAFFQTPVVFKDQLGAVVQLLTCFAQQVAQSMSRWIVSPHDLEPPSVTQAKRFVHAHLDESFRMREVAERTHLSAGYFSETFRKSAGMTFTEYVLRTRLEKAKELLCNPCKRISEVAYESGFQSIPYFNRAFKRHEGMSPSQYRSQLQRS